MAHVGKYYPVLLRRDWNLNIDNNRVGFARRNLAECTGLPNGVASVLNGFTFDCGPESYPFTDTVRWDSGFVPVAVHFYRMILESQIVTGYDYLNSGTIEVKNIGPILHWHWPPGGPGQLAGFAFPTGIVIDFYDTNYFDEEPSNFAPFVEPKLWTDGEPH